MERGRTMSRYDEDDDRDRGHGGWFSDPEGLFVAFMTMDHDRSPWRPSKCQGAPTPISQNILLITGHFDIAVSGVRTVKAHRSFPVGKARRHPGIGIQGFRLEINAFLANYDAPARRDRAALDDHGFEWSDLERVWRKSLRISVRIDPGAGGKARA